MQLVFFKILQESSISKTTLTIRSFDICFGHIHTKPEIILNHLILIAKFYVCQCKIAALISNMTGYVDIIKHTLKVEKGVALKKDKLDPFIKNMKKSPFLRLLALPYSYPCLPVENVKYSNC